MSANKCLSVGETLENIKMKLLNIVLSDFSQEDMTLPPSTKPPAVTPAVAVAASP